MIGRCLVCPGVEFTTPDEFGDHQLRHAKARAKDAEQGIRSWGSGGVTGRYSILGPARPLTPEELT